MSAGGEMWSREKPRVMNGKKKSRGIRDILELLYHDMTCMSSIMRAEVLIPNIELIDEIPSGGCHVQLELYVVEGPYRGGKFNLGLSITKDYPFKGPTFFTTEPLWHPNIDMQNGQINLPIEWSPVLRLYSIVFALQLLFLEPSDETFVNYEAGRLLHSNPALFEETCQTILHGGCIGGILYPNYILRGCNCWCKDQIPILKQRHPSSPIKCDIQSLNISSPLRKHTMTSSESLEFSKKRCHSDFDDNYLSEIDETNYRYCVSQNDWNKRRIIDMEISSTDEAITAQL